MLYALANGINARFDDFLEAEVADTGKPVSLASHIDIPRGAANFKVFADTIKDVSTEFFEMATPDGTGAINYAMRRPIGVIGVICPWNLPLLLMTWKAAPAMACGNTVVVKPSEESPQTAALLGEVMNAVGIPKGVYNVVHGFGPGSAGEFLTTHPKVDAITFTGETRTGAAIMKAAAEAPGRYRSRWAARTQASCSPIAISTPRSKAPCARASPIAARSASAPSASM